MRPTPRLLAAVLALGFVAAACGSDSDDTANDDTATVTPRPLTPRPELGGRRLVGHRDRHGLLRSR